MNDDWPDLAVADVTVMVKRGRAPQYADHGALVVSQKCIQYGNEFSTALARRTDALSKPVPEWAWLLETDTLVNSTGRGTLGRAAYVGRLDEPTTADSHVAIVRPDPRKVVPRFLGIVLSASFTNIESLQSGSTSQTELSPSSLQMMRIPVPPLPVQRRIVDLMAHLDNQIANLRTERDAGRGLRKATLSNLLDATREIPADYDAAFDLAFPAPQASPTSEPAMNDDWPSVRVDELLEASIGGVWGSDPGESDVDVTVFRSTDFNPDGHLSLEKGARRSVTTSQLASRQMRHGDVLLEKSGGGPNQPVGRVAYVEGAVPEPSVCANFIQFLRPDTNRVVCKYLFYALWADHSNDVTLEYQAQTTGIRNLRTKDYLARQIALPPLPEQRRIVDLMAHLDKQIAGMDVEVSTLESLRRQLLASLLSQGVELPTSYDLLLEGVA